MANRCYTKYCFEGPALEIRNMGFQVGKMLHRGKHDWAPFFSPFTYHGAGKGKLVLSFESNTSYAPLPHFGQNILETWGPHSRYAYYAEEILLEGAWTNDLEGRYFPWDYVVMAWKPERLMPALKKLFVNKAEYRMREDQYFTYFSYWKKEKLANALRFLVATSELPDDVLLDSILPKLESRDMQIYRIRHIRDLDYSPKKKSEINGLIHTICK